QWGPCGSEICAGAPSQPCERCGTQTRECNQATALWLDWSECRDQGECTPNEVQECGEGGMRTCLGTCNFDPVCRGQICDGPSTMACGNCGTSTRECNQNTGRWSEWSACSNEGACVPNSTQACGSQGTQTCGSDCQWNDACTG